MGAVHNPAAQASLSFLPVPTISYMEIPSNSTGPFAQHYLQHFPYTLMELLSLLIGTMWAFMQRGWILEGLKLLLFGSAMEAIRGIWASLSAKALQMLFTEALFVNGDFSFDWIDTYLKAHDVWQKSTSVRVLSIVGPDGQSIDKMEKSDFGHPRPVYQSTPDQPEFWRWKGHWIKVRKVHGEFEYRTGAELGGSITLSLYAWKRWVIKELIEEARIYYLTQSRPQLMPTQFPAGKAPSVLIATFTHPDQAYDWMLGFLGSLNAWKDVRQVEVSAKKSTSARFAIESSSGAAGRLSYMPSAEYPQLLGWNGYWIQVTRDKGSPHWRTGREEGGKLTVILHHTQRKVLDELVEAARQHSMEGARHYVSVHLADQHGAWTQVVHKARRRLDTLVLPSGTSELLLRDAREFLASEAWYKSAGVPYRRGYLLHGIPGAGKTSTIHAMASELMLPVYAVSLANKGMDDATLHALVAQTPAECILSIEDIDCAFPEPRGAEDDEDGDGDGDGGGRGGGRMEAMGPRAMQMNAMGIPTKSSEVTLSGLLNVIDGVWSEEGRLVFATTNHIKKLDPALLRPGRMDVQIEYSATTRDQARRLFVRFFPPGDSEEEETKIAELAEQFTSALPADTFSAAALQGYLLLWKNNASGAAENVGELVERHKKEEAERAAQKEKEKAARRRWLEARKKMQQEGNNAAGSGIPKAQEGTALP